MPLKILPRSKNVSLAGAECKAGKLDKCIWELMSGRLRSRPCWLTKQVSLLGSDNRALRPAILWNDGRSAGQCAALETSVTGMADITSNRAMPGFTAPKLLWVRENEPEVFAATRTTLLPKDYVRRRMTGDIASDMSDSASTLWLNWRRRCSRQADTGIHFRRRFGKRTSSQAQIRTSGIARKYHRLCSVINADLIPQQFINRRLSAGLCVNPLDDHGARQARPRRTVGESFAR
jgi:FGGY family of carbohydrate kinases, N-terminal domain